MSDLHERLAWARQNAGYETASDAARALNISIPTYVAHENGSRGIKRDVAERYARFFHVPTEWLLLGRGRPSTRPSSVQLVGYVGAGAEIFGIDDHAMGAGLDEIELPSSAPPNSVAVRVRGDSMMPVYRDGDLIIYNQQLQGEHIVELIGKEAIVRLADGRTFIKTIAKGSNPGTWTLWSYNAAPMTDALVEWAARVRWIERG